MAGAQKRAQGHIWRDPLAKDVFMDHPSTLYFSARLDKQPFILRGRMGQIIRMLKGFEK
jgi:hypothetical protein